MLNPDLCKLESCRHLCFCKLGVIIGWIHLQLLCVPSVYTLALSFSHNWQRSMLLPFDITMCLSPYKEMAWHWTWQPAQSIK